NHLYKIEAAAQSVRHAAMAELETITREEFQDHGFALPPLLRLGYSDGPGAILTSEPWHLRRCEITGKQDYSYMVYIVLNRSSFFRSGSPMTPHEFKALCDRIMPGVGICDWQWGADLLDEHGNLRSDLKFPIRYGEITYNTEAAP